MRDKLWTMLDELWTSSRAFVPIQVYPLLAPIHRLRRHRQLKQLIDEDGRHHSAHGATAIPPAELRFNVVGPVSIPAFLAGGMQIVDDMERVLRSASTSLAQCRDLLDFGCGCGRLPLALQQRWRDLNVAGCDVDERAIRWCQANLAGRYVINGALPPTPFADDSFDVIWCGSVFTHLDEDRQDRWLVELRRILRPGGILLASVHGPYCWEPRLPLWTRAALRKRGFLFMTTGADSGIHPDWYQVACHTEAYVKEHWSATFEILGYVAQGLGNYQDVVVARK